MWVVLELCFEKFQSLSFYNQFGVFPLNINSDKTFSSTFLRTSSGCFAFRFIKKKKKMQYWLVSDQSVRHSAMNRKLKMDFRPDSGRTKMGKQVKIRRLRDGKWHSQPSKLPFHPASFGRVWNDFWEVTAAISRKRKNAKETKFLI